MNILKAIYGKLRSRRGNALIMAILATMLLFIIGMAFLSTTIMEKATVVNLDQQDILDNGIQQVIDQINTVLAQDMSSRGLLNKEPYDYPGEADPWLASSEPEIYTDASGNTWHYWPHITDLRNIFIHQSVEIGDGSSTFSIGGIDFTNYGGPKAVYYYDPDDFYVDDNDINPWVPSTYPGPWMEADSANPLSQRRWVSAYHTAAKIINDEEPIKSCIVDLNPLAYYRDSSWLKVHGRPDGKIPIGSRADADGDGIADSRWVVIPDSKIVTQDQWLWMAVRIVDNVGMLNLNTALDFDPDASDGSILTDIDLTSIARAGDTPADLHGYRCAGNPAPASDYHFDVARRVMNPDQSGASGYLYNLFDLTDELEFRNRFFINTNVLPVSEVIWNTTFAHFPPNSNLKKSIPYFHSNPLDPVELQRWYQKASYDIPYYIKYSLKDLYTRRHICTTYNFDRVISPRFSGRKLTDYKKHMGSKTNELWGTWNKWQSWRGRPISVNDVKQKPAANEASVPQLAGAIWLGLYDDLDNGKDPNFIPLRSSSDPKWTNDQMRTRLACLMAVNLMDYIDDGDPNSVHTIADLPVYNKSGKLQGTESYYGFESQMNRLYLNKLGVCKYDDGTNQEEHYAVSLYNPQDSPYTAIGWQLVIGDEIIALKTFTAPANNTVVLVDIDDPNIPPRGYTSGDLSQTLVEVGDQLDLEIHKGKRMVLLHWNGTPVDAVKIPSSIPGGASPARIFHTTVERTGYIVGIDNPVYAMDPEPSWDSNTDADEVESKSAFTNAASVSAKIQLACRDYGTMLNISEVFNVLAIGGIKFEPTSGSDEYTSMSECWYRYIKALNNDIPVLHAGAGRFDAANGEKVGRLMQFLTVFAPFADGIDNDGDGRSDDPLIDGEDNNHDGIIDDPAETFANGYGDKYELNVAGRININTAPWFVIAQLPWIQDRSLPVNDPRRYALARAIVAYRDKKSLTDTTMIDAGPPARYLIDYAWPDLALSPPDDMKTRKIGMGLTPSDPDVREEPGFMYINELLNVTHRLTGSGAYDELFDIRYYGRNGVNDDDINDTDTDGVPNHKEGPFFDREADDATDDLEERDILFKRISNLVTVRSDVFTAYILVRLGRDGPQKRVIAIFDRSNVFSSGDKPKLVALHPVPDPR